MKPVALVLRSRGAYFVLATALLVTGCTAGRGRLGVSSVPGLVMPATPAPQASTVKSIANLGGFDGLLSGPSALVGNNSGSLIANNGSGLIANNGGGLVSNGGGNLISNNAGSYRVADTGGLTPVSGATVTVTDAEGHALSTPVQSDASGRFRIAAVKASGALVFLRATYRLGDRDVSLVLATAAPRAKGLATATLDPASSLVGKAIAERLRQGGTADAAEAESVAKLVRSVMSDAAVARACVETDAEADGTFDAMLGESPALADAVRQAAPSSALAPSAETAPKPSPSPSNRPSHHSGGGSSGPVYTHTGAITVTAFDRPSVTAGMHVVLTGTGFSAVPAENVVTMGSVPVTVVSSTATTLEIIAPDTASGPITVTVALDQGDSTDSLEIVPTAGGFVAGTDASGFLATPTDLWVINSGDNTLSVTPLAGGATVTHPVGAGYSPMEIATDLAGNFYVPVHESGLAKLGPDGTALGAYDAAADPAADDAHAVAISPVDQSIWVANYDEDTVAKLNSNGTLVDTFPVGDQPNGVAIGAGGEVWVADSDGLVTHLGADGSAMGSINVGNVPSGIAVDGNGHVWVTLIDVGDVVELDQTGGIVGQVHVGTVTHGIAIDENGAIWLPNGADNTVTRLGSDRAIEGVYPLAGTPTYATRGVDGRIWVLGTGDQKATAFTPAGTGLTIN